MTCSDDRVASWLNNDILILHGSIIFMEGKRPRRATQQKYYKRVYRQVTKYLLLLESLRMKGLIL